MQMLQRQLKLSEAVFRSAYSKIETRDKIIERLMIERIPGYWVEEIGHQDMIFGEKLVDAMEFDQKRVISQFSGRPFVELFGCQDINVQVYCRQELDTIDRGPNVIADEALFTLANNAKQNIAVLHEDGDDVTLVRLFMGDAFKCVMIGKTGVTPQPGVTGSTIIPESASKYSDVLIGNTNQVYAHAYMPDWDKLRWLTFGESLADGDDEDKRHVGNPTITTYCYDSETILQWRYRIHTIEHGENKTMLMRFNKEGYLIDTDEREDAMLPVKHLCDLLSETERYKMCLDNRRAKRMNAVCIPRPKPDLWTTDATVRQYISREKVAQVAPGEHRQFRVLQFHPYTNGGYDIANNKFQCDSSIKPLIDTLNWKVFAKSIKLSSMIVRVAVLTFRATWAMEATNVNTNVYADIALDISVGYDKNYVPKHVIIQLKPIEKFNPMMACTDIYAYDDEAREPISERVESIGLRGYRMGLIEYFQELIRYKTVIPHQEDFDLRDWIIESVKLQTPDIRKIAAQEVRRSFATKSNERVIRHHTDDELLKNYHIVPAEPIAGKLIYVSCAVVTKSAFCDIQPRLMDATYTNRLKCCFGVSSSMRDSLAMKLCVKNSSSATERAATEFDALKWCTSYTIRCVAKDELRINADGTVRLPCGFITNDYNSMINKHACVRTLMGIPPMNETAHIHGAYVCGPSKTVGNRRSKRLNHDNNANTDTTRSKGCGTIYQSNISALICNYCCNIGQQ